MANSVERFPRNPGIPSQSTVYSYQKTTSTAEDFGVKSHLPNLSGKEKQNSPFFRGLFWGATLSLTAAVSAAIGAAITLATPFSANLVPLMQQVQLPWQQGKVVKESGSSLLKYDLSRPVNILVMGIDRVPDAPKGSPEAFAGRSDTMLLLRFDPSDRSVRMLSIPRDSRVEIPEVGYGKINDANVQGGPVLAARVVSKTLNNIAIDRYLRITTDAFQELVDVVGGVEVFVPHPMSYRDLTQNLDIQLEAGWQTLNGDQAEQFARFRKDQYGDIGRVQRQQTLLKALQKRIYSPAIIPRIPQAMRILQQYIDTNLSLEEMLALAHFGQGLEKDQIKMVMLPGRFSSLEEYDARSYWVINESGRDRIMQEYFGSASNTAPERPLSPYRVRLAIQNSSDDPELGKQIVVYFQQHNFTNVYLINETPQVLRETEIVVQQGDLEAAKALQSLLGIGRLEASSTGDLESDLTIRLGLDAKYLLVGESFLKTSNRWTQPRQ